MITHEANLVSYLADRKAICETFFTDAADAEEMCDRASRCAHTDREQNAAQASLKSQIRTYARTRSEAIDALGPPPTNPTRK